MKAQPASNSIDFARRLDAARRGSRAAREELFQRYYAQVERIVHARLRRELGHRRAILAARFSTADVVQDVFHALTSGLDAFHGASEGEFMSYVVTTIQHRVVDTIRHHRASCRDYLRSTAPLDLAVTCSREPAVDADGLANYSEILAHVPADSRALLLARLERGLSFEALALEFGFPSRYSARRAFFAAQARLLAHLQGSDDARPDHDRPRVSIPGPGRTAN